MTAHTLSVDLVTAEVVAALREGEIDPILLKGPSIGEWLYAGGEIRPYGDSDLLVAPSDVESAYEALRALGFRYGYESLGPGPLQEGLWWSRGSESVHIHTSLGGVRADPARVWAILSAHVDVQRVGALEVRVLTPTARTMHIALHAAKHGRREPTPMGDLERALKLVPVGLWRDAASLAAELDATPAFATGLSLLPAGEALVARLRLEPDTSVRALLLAETPPPLALGLDELSSKQGLRDKAHFVARKLFPSRTYMRYVVPFSRRGTAALFLAYFHRIVWLSAKLLPALVAWAKARRESR